MAFRVLATCPTTGARAGLLSTTHGDLATPAFMPVGTLATVKTLTPADVRSTGAQCLLSNAYHLAVQPGSERIRLLGGLHQFMGWDGPILTDSGGFQIFSLARLREVSETGVQILSPVDQRPLELTPERVITIQEQLGSDIMMPLDICLGPDANEPQTALALDKTRRWAMRSLNARPPRDQQLFAIVQGGFDVELREQAARDLSGYDFDGFALGGLSVGEPLDVTTRMVGSTIRHLPADRPRYLMGVGTPGQIVTYTGLGVDMFDCVLPTRLGRTGTAFAPEANLVLNRSSFRTDERPIDPSCDCATCQRFSRAMLHSTLRMAHHIAARLISVHNVRMLIRIAESARQAILAGTFATILAVPDAAADATSRLLAAAVREFSGRGAGAASQA